MIQIIERLKEPSSYAALSGLALVAGVSAEEYQIFANLAAAAFAVVAFFLKEKAS